MAYTKLLVLALALCLLGSGASAQQPVAIQGVWQLLSQKIDGKANTPTNMLKTITKDRYSWIRQDNEELLAHLARNTRGDSLEAFNDHFSAAYGTYTLIGDTYTEKVEFMSVPVYIGRSFPFQVKIEGGHLFQSGKFPITDADGRVQEVLLEEEYQRLE